MTARSTPPPSDRGRSEVYAAELMAFDGTELEELVPFEELVATAERITSASWWPVGPTQVLRARRDARSSTTRSWPGAAARQAVIRLAAPQCTPATLIHELAHVLAGAGSGHGPCFRRAHVDLAAAAFGEQRSGWLASAYCSAGLELGDRTWPSPPSSPPAGRSSTPIAL